MKIELATPTLLKISWPLYPSEIHQEIVRRLSTVPGMEAGRGRCCYAPMIQLARLSELFPKASFDYRAMQESDTLARRFFDSMTSMGVCFDWDEFDDVMAVGDNVSPVLQKLVHDRRHALKPLVIEAQTLPKPPVRREVQAIAEVNYPKRKRKAKAT